MKDIQLYKHTYTKEFALTHDKPELDMRCLVDYNCVIKGYQCIDEVIFKYDTAKEVVCIGSDRLSLVIDRSEFNRFSPIDDRTEKEKQRDNLVDLINKSEFTSATQLADALLSKYRIEAI